MPESAGYPDMRSGQQNIPKETPSSPFLELPPEVRVMIYRLMITMLVDPSMRIADVNLEDYLNGRPTGFSPKQSAHTGFENDDCSVSCGLKPKRGNRYYLLHDQSSLDGFGLLSANRLIRSETMPLFYSLTHFNFCSDSPVIPFLNDQSKLARESIKNLPLYLKFEEDKYQVDRQANWTAVFHYIAQHLKLKSMTLFLQDYTGQLLESLDFWGETVPWIGALTQIKNLETFGFHISIPPHQIGPHKTCTHCDGSDCWKFRNFLKSKLLKAK